MNKTTTPQVRQTMKLRPHQGKARSMSVGDMRETVLRRVEQIKDELVDRVSGALDFTGQIAKDLKDYREFRESINKRLFDFAQRLTLIENDMKAARATDSVPAPITQKRGPGRWPLPLQRPPARSSSPTGVDGNRSEGGRRAAPRDELAEYEDRQRPRIGPVADYAAMRAEAAEKAKKELPETVSTNDLARYFGVSRSKVWTMATRGELRVIRRGQSFLFPRAEIVDYIRSRGAPHGKKPFYGSAGIVEYRK